MQLFGWGLGRLEPAIHRTAMNPDSFGKGFNGAPLLQVNFDHLLALCASRIEERLGRRWSR